MKPVLSIELHRSAHHNALNLSPQTFLKTNKSAQELLALLSNSSLIMMFRRIALTACKCAAIVFCSCVVSFIKGDDLALVRAPSTLGLTILFAVDSRVVWRNRPFPSSFIMRSTCLRDCRMWVHRLLGWVATFWYYTLHHSTSAGDLESMYSHMLSHISYSGTRCHAKYHLCR